MNIQIRTDASILIGTGHVMRCLTLADYLSTGGAQVVFVCRELPGHLADLIKSNGYPVQLLPTPKTEYSAGENSDDYAAWLGVPAEQDAAETITALEHVGGRIDWLVVDHYGLGIDWEDQLGQHVQNLMVIDDLANRKHECALLLDQNFYLDLETRYDNLIPRICRTFLGPANAILRPEFFEARQAAGEYSGKVGRILISYGGCDATGETIKTLRAIGDRLPPGMKVDIVAGATNSRLEEIKQFCSGRPELHLHQQVDEMAKMMSRADFAFGGGGTTTWERCFLGLPSATIEVADNQKIMLHALQSRGAIWHLGCYTDVTEAILAECFDRAINRPDEVLSLGRKTQAIMAGLSDKSRCPVATALMEWNKNL